MNLDDFKKQEVKPIFAFIGYSGGYIESHDIKDGKLGVAKPITVKTAERLVSIAKNSKSGRFGLSGRVPKNLLYVNATNSCIVWSVKGTTRDVWFSKGRLTIKVPTLVFRLSGDRVEVWATRVVNPKDTTRLFHAPFPNVYQGTSKAGVCWGNADKVKGTDIPTLMDAYTKLFFESRFTGEYAHNFGYAYWKKNKYKPSDLAKTTLTLEQIFV